MSHAARPSTTPSATPPAVPSARRARCATAALALLVPFAWTLAPLPAVAVADGCPEVLDADFDGDGSTDVVVADPAASVGGHAGAGLVTVLTTDGLGAIGDGPKASLSQASTGVADDPGTGDGFGSALAVADLDCDDFTDLVVGVPGEARAGHAGAGMVQVVWGSAQGLGHGQASTQLDAASFGQAPATGDRFGAALDAVEQAGQDGTPAPDAYALAIGVPGRDVGGKADAGAAALVLPWDGGSERLFVTQDSPGVAGAAEAGDGFGSAVALGYLAGGPFLDAAVGVPGEDRGSTADTGAVELLTDVTPDGADGSVIDQDSAGVPGSAEAGDRFGAALDAVQRDRKTGFLAVGVPREDVGDAKDAGAVQVFRQQGEQLVPGVAITQDSPGVGGAAEAGDRFGSSLTFGAQFHDEARLLVGVPYEDGTGASKKDIGAVQELSATSPGTDDRSWTQDSAGLPGSAQAGEHFGAAVARVYGNEDLWLVGVPDDVAEANGMVDVIDRQDGQDRAWVPGQGGVPGAGASRFGATLASGGGSL